MTFIQITVLTLALTLTLTLNLALNLTMPQNLKLIMGLDPDTDNNPG